MKTLKFLLGVLVLVALVSFGEVPTGPTSIRLIWTYPETNTDVTFFVYGSTNVAAPKPWTAITNTVGTNMSVVIKIQPGKMFFYCTASNFWGESIPSDTANTPAVPTNSVLKITREP